MKQHPHWIKPLALAIALACGVQYVNAAEPGENEARLDVRQSFSIPAQPLADALLQFSEQADIQVMTASADLSNLVSNAVSGENSVRKALQNLLQGTGLDFHAVSNEAVSIEPVNTSGLQNKGVPEILVTGSKRTGSLNVDMPRSESGAQPYVVLDRDQIEQSAASNVEQFLKERLTMNASPIVGAQGANFGNSSINLRGLGANQTLILIDGRRVAGWVQQGEPQQPDINGIPLAAIERIEVLPATASGIYGGSALGGVINIVLRRDYSGSEIRYDSSYGADFSSEKFGISAGLNANNGRTNIIISGSIARSVPLKVKDRDFFENGRAFVLENSHDYYTTAFVPPLGSTTNIRSESGEELTLKNGDSLNSSITHVPRGYSGTLSDGGAALINNAGRYNLGLADTRQSGGGGSQELFSNPRVEALSATVRHKLTSRVQAFIELSASNNLTSVGVNNTGGTFTIPVDSPNNPFNQRIIVTTPAFGADGINRSETRSRRAVLGAIMNITDTWNASFDYTWNQSRFSSWQIGDATELASVPVAEGEINILRDTNLFPASFAPFIGIPTVIPVTHSTLKNVTLRAAGPVLTLPAGDLTISALVERRTESYSDSEFVSSNVHQLEPGRSQSVNSAYLEARIPVFSEKMNMPGMRKLDLQVAVRRDAYKVNGTNSIDIDAPTEIERVTNKKSSVDPTFGVLLQPIQDVTLRASYGTGYLPPSVSQLVPNARLVVPAGVVARRRMTDPRRGNEPVIGALDLTLGGNPSLLPEESKSWSVGLIITPRIVKNLRISADWTRIKKKNNIEALVNGIGQFIFDVEEFVPGVVVRSDVAAGDPYDVGPVTGVNAGLFNLARAEVEALDVSLDYSIDTANLGRFILFANATRLIDIKSQLTPDAPYEQSVGVISALRGNGGGLKWKANGSLIWNYGSFSVAWTTRFFDSYWLNTDHSIVAIQGNNSIPSQTYHDLNLTYRFDGKGREAAPGWRKLLNNTEVRFGISNVFNKKPPIDVVGSNGVSSSTGYSVWGDPRLATYHFVIRKSL